MPRYCARLSIAMWLAALSLARGADAQPTAVPNTRNIVVNGRSIRVLATGIEQRRAEQPVLILEAGAGAGLDEWAPAIPGLAKLAPVIPTIPPDAPPGLKAEYENLRGSISVVDSDDTP
jgi:hypothetical protein